MNLKWTAKLGAFAMAACVALASVPAYAAENKPIRVKLADVTNSDLTTLSGEAKVLVSVEGAEGNATIAQMSLDFEGDLKYKSIRFLKGENNAPEGVWIFPNTTAANENKKLSTGIISKSGLAFTDSEDLFIVTFAGDAGQTGTVKLSDLKNTYCTVDGSDRFATDTAEISITASKQENKGIQAGVRLVMDKVPGFPGTGTAGITVTITREDDQAANGYTVSAMLNNALVSKGGHRESATTPTFYVEETLLADSKYTVEVTGIGYIPYKKTGVTFAEVLQITNADFIPGDVNNDGIVNNEDKAEVEALIQNDEYSEAGDFNRDGKVNALDLEVFKDLPEDKNVPAQMTAPTVTGGSNEISVTWTKPSDESVTGYTIRYGTDKYKLTNTKEIDSADTTRTTITRLAAGTTYYVQIAAKNAGGTGAYSNAESAKTTSESGNTGGGSSGGSTGGGSAGGGGGGSIGGGGTGGSGNAGKTEGFTDIDRYGWAKDSIYSLKDKGIISGVSATEFAPANPIKRGDFILILTRMLSVNDDFAENFADVPESAYYYNAIGSAKAAGIAQGSGDNFMPENSITRQDLITLAYRAFLGKGYISETTDVSELDAFADKDAVAEYAKTAMASMVKAGIIQGSDGMVNPTGNATRAEVAVMCARLYELVK